MGAGTDRLPAGPLTYEDYAALPEDGNRYELFDGELVVSPAPRPRHQGASLKLASRLLTHAEAHALGRVYTAPIDVILSPTTVLQPDIVFVAKGHERIITERAIEAPPDLVVEILSPGTSRRDRGAKARLYARFGIAHYWILDPKAHTFEAFVLEGRAYRLVTSSEGTATVAAAPFAGLSIDLAAIWD
jgi:Uma2 family endonuclease